MPTVGHDIDKRRSCQGRLRGRNRWRSSQRGIGRSFPFAIIMIKTLFVVTVGM